MYNAFLVLIYSFNISFLLIVFLFHKRLLVYIDRRIISRVLNITTIIKEIVHWISFIL